MTVISGSGDGVVVGVDVGTKAPAAKLASLRAAFGSPGTWGPTVGVVEKVIDSWEAIEVHVRVYGPFTGTCELLSETGSVLAAAQIAVETGAAHVLRFKLTPNEDRGRRMAQA